MSVDERLALIRVKIDWAKKHYSDLEVARDRFIDSNPYALDFKPDPRPGHEGLNLWFMTRIDPIPNEISLLAGDAVHSLRSALDHLVCQLVLVEDNSISDQASFPIFKGTLINEPSFARKVEGMPQSAKDRIRSTEPYKYGKGHHLWILHELDIADKHHGLLTTLFKVESMNVEVRKGLGVQRSSIPKFALPDFGESLEVNKPFFTCEPGAEHDSYFDFDIAISQPNVVRRKPVIWSIKYLIDKIDGLIGEFASLLG